MFLTLGTSHSRVGTAAWEYALLYPGRRQPVANVFPRLEQRPSETGVCGPRTVWKPATEDTITAVVERESWCNT
jgi:hypothetical protein